MSRVAPIVEAATPVSSGLPGPGPFEQLSKESRDVFTTNYMFDGAKFELTKMLSPMFQVNHRFALGSAEQPAGHYSFGPFFATNKGFVMAEIDSAFNLNGRFQHALTEHLTLKGVTQMMPQGKAFIGELDYSRGDFSSNFKIINPNLFDGTGVVSLSYLQSVSHSLACGIEATGHLGPFKSLSSSLAFVGRYGSDNAVVNAKMTTNGEIQLSYFQKVTDQISIASEFEAMIGAQKRDSIASIGAKFDLRGALLRAQVDTGLKVAMVLEEKITPGFSLLITGELDHYKSSSRFGVGLHLGA